MTAKTRTKSRALFALGRLVATPGALAHLQPDEGLHLLARHVTGDWGELDAHDRRANDRAVRDGSRILSAYITRDHTCIWVLTEADRSYTTLLRPDEYQHRIGPVDVGLKQHRFSHQFRRRRAPPCGKGAEAWAVLLLYLP